MFPAHIIDAIKNSAYWADRAVRSDLACGYIANENDYTSNFTSEFRRQINARAIVGLKATSFLLPAAYERKFGVDACIILSNSEDAKICLIEGKWPRFHGRPNSWDYKQASSDISHFTTQIERQRWFSSSVAIWEMFYCGHEFGGQPAPFRKFVSSCVPHSYAYAYLHKRLLPEAVWKDADLIELISSVPKNETRVDLLIERVCSCKFGKKLPINDLKGFLGNMQAPMQILSIVFRKESGSGQALAEPLDFGGFIGC